MSPAISNPSSFSQVAAKGTCLGEASSVTLVDPDDYSGPDDSLLPADENTTMPEAVDVRRVDACEATEQRKEKLLQLVPKAESLDPEQQQRLDQLLTDHHQAFSVDEFDRGETNLLEMKPNQHNRCSTSETTPSTDAVCCQARGGTTAQEDAGGRSGTAIQ